MATAAEPRPGPAPAPPPPPPPEHAQPKDKEKDKTDYYGYLYEANKTPTKTFDALLRAIAKHVVRTFRIVGSHRRQGLIIPDRQPRRQEGQGPQA